MASRSEQATISRAHLVAVATRLFAEHGFAGTSTAALLDAACVSRGALYHHFASKDQLFEAVLDEVEAQVAVALARAAEPGRDAADALVRAAQAFLGMAVDPVVGRIVLLEAPAAVGWERWRAIDQRHGFGLLKPAVASAAAEAGIEPGTEDELAHVVLAAIMELALLVAHADKPSAELRRAEKAAAVLLTRLFVRT